MKGLAIGVGILMLLPGLCSLLFTPMLVGGGDFQSLILVLWLAGLAIGLGGIFLIYMAVRNPWEISPGALLVWLTRLAIGLGVILLIYLAVSK